MGISESLTKLGKTLLGWGKAFLKSAFFQGLCSGLIPALIAIYFVMQGLDQTTYQIKILQEQISYARKPVLVVSSTPNFRDMTDITPKLTVSNVGNEPAENVFFKFHLMLVSDTSIFSIGQRHHNRSYFVDSTRFPKEKLWPRLTINPDSQEVSIGHRVYGEVIMAYIDLPDSSFDPRQELIDLRLKLGGTYILYLESSYRRQSDYVYLADTTILEVDPILGSFEPIEDEIGGPAIRERVKSYLFNGPQHSINLFSDRYEFYLHHTGRPEVRPEEIRVIMKPGFSKQDLAETRLLYIRK